MNSQPRRDDVHAVLADFLSKGIRLWSQDGELRYCAPKGVLTPADLDTLRLSRDQISALLNGATDTRLFEPPARRAPRSRAPLAFSQLAMWNLGRLRDGRAMRQIASASRLLGLLNVGALRKSVREAIRRHESLRTRIIVTDGVPEQEIISTGDTALEFADLTPVPAEFRELEVRRRIEELILEPVDLSVGPLFATRLFKVREDEHVMVVAMAHMISDEASLEILWRDILTGYVQVSKSRPFSLPKVHIQFPDYAAWQIDSEHWWHRKHDAHYEKHFAMCEGMRFPVEPCTGMFGTGKAVVPIRIERSHKAELVAWCKSKRTTLVMSVLTAYVALILRWSDRREVVVQYQSDGRTNHQMANTIGCFTSALFMRIRLQKGDRLVDLLQRVVQEYCLAYEHLDSSYFVAQTPRPELTRTTAFNWVPQRPVLDCSTSPESEIAKTDIGLQEVLQKVWRQISDPNIDPLLLLYDTEEEVAGGLYFPLERFSVESMERFGRNLLLFIRALLRTPERPVEDIVLG